MMREGGRGSLRVGLHPTNLLGLATIPLGGHYGCMNRYHVAALGTSKFVGVSQLLGVIQRFGTEGGLPSFWGGALLAKKTVSLIPSGCEFTPSSQGLWFGSSFASSMIEIFKRNECFFYLCHQRNVFDISHTLQRECPLQE